MKLTHVLPLAAVSSALVLPSEEVFQRIQYEEDRKSGDWYKSIISSKDKLLSTGADWAESVYAEGENEVTEAWEGLKGINDECLERLKNGAFEIVGDVEATMFDKVDDVKSWFESTLGDVKDRVSEEWEDVVEEQDFVNFGVDKFEELRTSMDDFVGSWTDLDESEDDDDVDESGGHHGHHGGHHGHHGDHGHTANYTVLELINYSKYSTTLSKLISKHSDIVDRLNSTKHNYTVFAPTDKAFSKIPEKVLNKLSKKEVEAILNYHIVPGVYPSGRLFFTQTAPTYLMSSHLADKPQHQRITFRKGLKGLSVNFFSRVVAANIFGSNGVVHGVDTPIFPPIGAIQEIDLFPGAFSTLELALVKTGLLDELNSTDHAGGTLFAPNNWAFEKLGPKVNAFLFSSAGKKYLKALLQYHVVPDNTLYSDAYYHGDHKDGDHDDDDKTNSIHVDLPTALEGHNLAIDISRWGPIVSIHINGFTRVAVADVVAEDGVIHVLTSVLIPPRKPRSAEEASDDDEELTVEELMERLEPYIETDVRKQDL